MKIAIITDSYGGPRSHNGVCDLSLEETYPELIKKEVSKQNHEVMISYAGFRRLVELPEIIKEFQTADIFVLQTGIVDLFPRPLSYEHTISQAFIWKALRRIIRLNRRAFIKYINHKPWSTEEHIISSITNICSNTTKKIIWVNVAIVNKYQDHQTPGANDAIRRINILIKEIIKKYPYCIELDICNILSSLPDYEDYMHGEDSHLNAKGNKLYAEEILKMIKKLV